MAQYQLCKVRSSDTLNLLLLHAVLFSCLFMGDGREATKQKTKQNSLLAQQT